MPQFRADVTSILLACTEVLPCLAPSLDGLFAARNADGGVGGGGGGGGGADIDGTGGGCNKVNAVVDIHSKCCHLFSALAVVGVPPNDIMETLQEHKVCFQDMISNLSVEYKVVHDLTLYVQRPKSRRKRALLLEETANKATGWMHLIRPGMLVDKVLKKI